MKKTSLLLTLGISLVLLATALIAQTYEVKVLPCPEADQTYAWAINDVGQIVGFNINKPPYSNYDVLRWDSSDSFILIVNPQGWSYKSAYSINNLGWIAGHCQENIGDYTQGLVWDIYGNYRILSKPESWKDASSFAINDFDQVSGRIDDAAGYAHTVLWDNAGHHILNHAGWENSWPLDINNLGQIAGRVWNRSGSVEEHHAAIWNSDGTFVDVHPHGFTYSLARSINDFGEVLLWAWGRSKSCALVRDINGRYRKLRVPSRWEQEGPGSINNNGQVLMRAISKPYRFEIYLVDRDGKCIILPRPEGWGDIWGDGLNNYGEIVAVGHDPSGKVRPLYWKPTD